MAIGSGKSATTTTAAGEETIFGALSRDHRTVDQLFAQFESAPQGMSQQQCGLLFEQLKRELLVHAKAEEKTFYAAIKREDGLLGDAAREARHGKREHKEIEAQLQKMDRLRNYGSSEWMQELTQLKQLVQHHVNEEEGEIFEEARQVLSEQQLRDLKREFLAAKQDQLQQLKMQDKIA